MDPRNLGGIVLAMVGMIWYTTIKQREAEAKKKATAEANTLEVAVGTVLLVTQHSRGSYSI